MEPPSGTGWLSTWTGLCFLTCEMGRLSRWPWISLCCCDYLVSWAPLSLGLRTKRRPGVPTPRTLLILCHVHCHVHSTAKPPCEPGSKTEWKEPGSHDLSRHSLVTRSPPSTLLLMGFASSPQPHSLDISLQHTGLGDTAHLNYSCRHCGCYSI